MPALAAHYYLGQAVLSELPPDIKECVTLSKPMFDLGLQGPDIWFYHKALTSNYPKTYGTLLHSRPAIDFIETACVQIAKSGDSNALAYLYGFVCHFMLDSTCHPAVNEYAKTMQEHIALETELDRVVLLDKEVINPEKMQRYGFVPKAEEIDYFALCIVYSELSNWDMVNPEKTDPFKKVISDLHFYGGFLHSPTGFMKGVVSIAEKLMKSEVGIAELPLTKKVNDKWVEPAGNIFGMFSLAKEDGVLGIINVAKRLSEKEPLSQRFNRIFD